MLVFAPIIAIYLLLDWQRMIDVLESLIPPHRKDIVLRIIHDVDHSLTGFIRGQSLICLFLGLWYAIGLSLAGLHFAVLIGASAGFFSFIPFVGSMGGLIVALGFGLVQFWPDYWSVLGFCQWPIFGRQYLVASHRRRGRWPSSGLVDVFAFCFWQSVWVLWFACRGSLGGHHRGIIPPCHSRLSRKHRLS